MATRKPLVIVGGQKQEMQAGDTIDSSVFPFPIPSNFAIDGGSATTIYPANAFKIDFGAAT